MSTANQNRLLLHIYNIVASFLLLLLAEDKFKSEVTKLLCNLNQLVQRVLVWIQDKNAQLLFWLLTSFG
jgi:hypothetical protein